MKNLIAELLIKIAKKDEETKALTAQIEALEIVVAALLTRLDDPIRQQVSETVITAMRATTELPTFNPDNSAVVENHIHRLLTAS